MLRIGLLALAAGSCAPPAPPDAKTVVLVHGLGRTRASMALLGRRLGDAGYRVVNVGYPSTRLPMEALVDTLRARLVECCPEPERVHFVTHSMGGIVVRRYLAEYSPEHQGRVVMLSPPSQGSEVIDVFSDSPLLRRLLGPSGAALGTDSSSIPSRLGPARFQLGVITGSRSVNPINSWLIPGPDDGKVAVARARVAGAAFLVVPATHPFIMNRRDVAREVVSFLRTGRFTRQELPDGTGGG
ncbi:MAG: alpha/beta hydrolase [Gemmatimonadetes bacterium]|nr:alpha/beta hydrolase [Gemmatimonadota bacterium]